MKKTTIDSDKLTYLIMPVPQSPPPKKKYFPLFPVFNPQKQQKGHEGETRPCQEGMLEPGHEQPGAYPGVDFFAGGVSDGSREDRFEDRHAQHSSPVSYCHHHA